MGLLIKVKKVNRAPKSIEDLKKMGEDMNEINDPADDADESSKSERDESDGDVEPDLNNGENPQDRNSEIDDLGETEDKILKQKFKANPKGILGMSEYGENCGHEHEEKESLKMFLRGLLGLM